MDSLFVFGTQHFLQKNNKECTNVAWTRDFLVEIRRNFILQGLLYYVTGMFVVRFQCGIHASHIP
jgi:hypothetical protein